MLVDVLAKRLIDKGPQFVGAHVLKVRKLATDHLHVETAFNGSQVLTKLWNDRHVEVLITDVNMPGISGYQRSRASEVMGFGASCPRQRHVPDPVPMISPSEVLAPTGTAAGSKRSEFNLSGGNKHGHDSRFTTRNRVLDRQRQS